MQGLIAKIDRVLIPLFFIRMKGNEMSTYSKMKKAYDDARPSFWEGKVSTGYFSTYRGAKNERHSLVHLVHGKTPICGSKVAADMKYSFCSYGVHMPYVECKHCKQIYNRENSNA